MYRKTIEEVQKELQTNLDEGLKDSEALKRLETYGYNELKEKKKQSMLVRFLLQFKDIMIIILIIAGIVQIVIEPSDWVDSLIIFIVIIINAILGLVQENKAEKSLEALEKMSAPMCKVLRDGVLMQISTRMLVPGDVVVFEAGDYIPADCRVTLASFLEVDESALTGESVPVEKNVLPINKDNIPLGDMKNMVFQSTYITKGRGKAIVVKTGMNTQIGTIAGMLTSSETTKTPLQSKLDQVGKTIGYICLAICLVVFILEYINTRQAFESIKTAIALAVAAIPEGLATVVTIVLAIGVNTMAKQNAIVKKLPAVETLGSTSVVCSDKTGTLTQNKMTVVEVYRNEIRKLSELTEEDKEIISYFALCSDAKIEFVDGEEKRIGDPTETALIELNNKYGVDIKNIKRICDVPFDSDRKMMSVVVKLNDKILLITKGAPDQIINHSVNKEAFELALQVNENMAQRALRVLGIGVKELTEIPSETDASIEEGLTFLGLVGMIDPARPEVKKALEVAKSAGIRTVMITGDHKITAKAIAEDLGILENHKAISSEELHELSDEYLDEHIEDYAVFARVAPEDKVRIVTSWQKKDKVVAMTGDGVNDSPALKKADIGCAMGITGTDVAKEASDMILVDDNFSTIISAVKQGRGIYENVKKCVKYLLSSNIGEVLTILIASILAMIMSTDFGVPLLPIHLLWINLITDSLPAFGLGMEKPSDDIMNYPPRPKNESFFANKLALHISLEGIAIGILTLISYVIGYFTTGKNHMVGQTMAFLTLSGCQLFHAYNVKSNGTVFKKDTFNNKFLNLAFVVGFILQFSVMYIPGLHDKVFKLAALSFSQVAMSIGIAFTIVIIMEIFKLFGYHKKK